MKRILLLATGGTITSKKYQSGLAPALKGQDLIEHLRTGYGEYHYDYEDLLDLDSSNIQPEEWKLIARRIFRVLDSYDGVIITHGTDTLAYTASALSFMLQNLKKVSF